MTESMPPSRLDTGVSHSARIWNYWLGGKDNYEVDRNMGDMILELVPELAESARADREYLARVVRFLAGDAGIRQFLDVGTGLPTQNNTHQVAQQVAPDSRIVYVDNDPMVLVHARALLTSTPEGATAYIDADVNDPDAIIAQARQTLDLTRPVAITMLGVVNFIVDDDAARTIIRRLVNAVPAGSYLALSHPTSELTGEAATRALDMWNGSGAAPMCLRTAAGLEGFFEGLELVDPGVVSCSRWRPDSPDAANAAPPDEVMHFGGVARIP